MYVYIYIYVVVWWHPSVNNETKWWTIWFMLDHRWILIIFLFHFGTKYCLTGWHIFVDIQSTVLQFSFRLYYFLAFLELLYCCFSFDMNRSDRSKGIGNIWHSWWGEQASKACNWALYKRSSQEKQRSLQAKCMSLVVTVDIVIVKFIPERDKL